jgi:hypothetical protein
LDLLGFIRPNWGFSMRYGESKQFFFPTLAALAPVCARGLVWLAAILMTRTVDALIRSYGDYDIKISSFPEAFVLKTETSSHWWGDRAASPPRFFSSAE